MLPFLADAPQIVIDTAAAALIASAIGGGLVSIGTGVYKGASMLVKYLANRDEAHHEEMLASMGTMTAMQAQSVLVMERMTVAMKDLQEDLHRDHEATRKAARDSKS